MLLSTTSSSCAVWDLTIKADWITIVHKIMSYLIIGYQHVVLVSKIMHILRLILLLHTKQLCTNRFLNLTAVTHRWNRVKGRFDIILDSNNFNVRQPVFKSSSVLSRRNSKGAPSSSVEFIWIFSFYKTRKLKGAVQWHPTVSVPWKNDVTAGKTLVWGQPRRQNTCWQCLCLKTRDVMKHFFMLQVHCLQVQFHLVTTLHLWSG